jgi:signal transduction histidine kinase
VIASRVFATRAQRPASTELVPLVERAGLIELLRVTFVVAALAATVLVPSMTGAEGVVLVAVSVVYLSVSAGPQLLSGRGNRTLIAAMGGALLLDGIYLMWLMSVTGGITSPLFPLVYVHVVAVTLVASYRTGLKLALWHTLLFLLLYESIALHFVTPTGGVATLTPSALRVVVTTRLTALWLATLVTAAFAAFAERELRAQKVDLQHLSDMDADIERAHTADQIAGSLLDRMRDVFGFVRGAVLVSAANELLLVSAFGDTADDPAVPADDRVIQRACSTRKPALVRALDPSEDPRLSALLPEARNVVVVPLLGIGGSRMGVMVLEWPASSQLKVWVVDLVQQFASHAAMRLQNVRLLDRVEAQLTEISGLKSEVQAQNVTLEAKVAEQTQELRETVTQLREVDEHRQRLLSHLVTAQEEERQRIAGDVHDDPVQRVVAVNMRLQLRGDRGVPHRPGPGSRVDGRGHRDDPLAERDADRALPDRPGGNRERVEARRGDDPLRSDLRRARRDLHRDRRRRRRVRARHAPADGTGPHGAQLDARTRGARGRYVRDPQPARRGHVRPGVAAVRRRGGVGRGASGAGRSNRPRRVTALPRGVGAG